MSKEDSIEVKGTVLENFPAGFLVYNLSTSAWSWRTWRAVFVATAFGFWRATKSPWNFPRMI